MGYAGEHGLGAGLPALFERVLRLYLIWAFEERRARSGGLHWADALHASASNHSANGGHQHGVSCDGEGRAGHPQKEARLLFGCGQLKGPDGAARELRHQQDVHPRDGV